MKTVTKTILRATKESAQKAAQAHVEKMEEKGWSLDMEFGGNAGCKYEVILEMSK